MLKVTTTVTYKIPHHECCNLNGGGLCRFATLGDCNFKCALFNDVLTARNGNVYKCDDCLDSVNSQQARIDDPDVDVDPKTIIRHTIKEFKRVYKKLRAKRYSEGMALSLAEEQVKDDEWLL